MNQSVTILCPSCNSSKVTKQDISLSNQLTLGPSFEYNGLIYKCSSCGAEGDFTPDITDENYQGAEKAAQTISIGGMIDYLNSKDISMARFERAFELPFRTLTRWKGGDFSSSALALLRTVNTFPWLTDVAECRFSPNVSNGILWTEAAKSLTQSIAMVPGATFNISACQSASFSTAGQSETSSITATVSYSIDKKEAIEIEAVTGGTV